MIPSYVGRRTVTRLLAVFLSLCFSIQCQSESFAFDDPEHFLQWNRPAEKSVCPDVPTFVWVEHERGEECIRYFPGDDIRNAPVVIAQFYGDRDKVMGKPVEQIRNNTRRSQEGYAVRQSGWAGVPVVVVARPGTYGSSGDHRQRRQPKEYYSLNVALDQIKERYGIEHFVLSGHSGGATTAAALLTLGRSDVRCAVLSSGAYSLLTRAEMLRKADGRKPRPGRDTTGLTNPHDPLDHVNGIIHDAERLVIVMGNVADTVTPFVFQVEFAKALEEAGHQVRLETHPAREPSFHNLLGRVVLESAANCGRNR